MTIQNPHLLPKVRSKSLRDACRLMPCTLRVASFVGQQCAPQSTVVPCHVETIGKGTATKVSDLFIAAGCATCHDIVDYRGKNTVRAIIEQNYAAAYADQIMRANHETIARWVMLGVLPLPDDAEVI